jgi:hypothetical protein
MHGKLGPPGREGKDRACAVGRGFQLPDSPGLLLPCAAPVPGGLVNDVYHAGPGWDPVTGWGSPNAQVLIPLLSARRSP